MNFAMRLPKVSTLEDVEEIRASVARQSNRITNPRLLAAAKDPGYEMIVEAARRMPSAGHRRANLIAADQRTRWAKAYLEFIDEARLFGTSDVEILAFCEAVAEAGRQCVYVGTGIPQETVGEALALEAVAEADANRDTAKLIDAPKCPSRLRALWNSLTFHQARLDRTRRVVAREMLNGGVA
jgi:hypothetical protein